MIDKKSSRRKNSVRYALIGTLAITSLVVSGKLFTHMIARTDAQQPLLKDLSVVSPDAPEAERTGVALSQIAVPEEKKLITTYTVKTGDTLGEIAQSFSVSTNTIRWANDIPIKGTIKVGDELVILPFTGIRYTVKKGDSLSTITLKYGGEQVEIMDINGLEDEKDIKPGDVLLIPDGEIPNTPAPKPVVKNTPTKSNLAKNITTDPEEESVKNTKDSLKVFINPILGSVLTQGLHDGRAAVDFGAPIGTTVRAAAEGTVLVARQGGYNGGYGNYIVITHPKGSQTLYAHLSNVEVSVGENVTQGEEIAKSGNSGHSTGAHLHFKVIGAVNPFGHDAKGTRY